MSIRAKTKKRLLILGVCFTVLVTLGTTLGVYQTQQREKRLQEHRQLGMDAMEREEYSLVVDHLSRYWRHNRDDLEAAYALAVARKHVEHPEGRHLREATSVYRSILEQDPHHEEAQRDLLEIYSLVHRDIEAIELARRLLDAHPEDLEAMHHKIVSLMRLRRHEEARRVTEQAVTLDPTNLSTHEFMLLILRRLDRPAEDLRAWARQYHEEHPDDPGLEVLVGYAYGITGDSQEAVAWLSQAAERELDDPLLIRRLVSLLAEAGQFPESRQLLHRSVERVEDDDLKRMFARSLWEERRYSAVQEFLADLDPTSPGVHSELVALKAASRFHTGDRERASELIAALREREGDNTATAWAPVLEQVLGAEDHDPRKAVAVCREALAINPNTAYIRGYLAESLVRIGETELAIDEWQSAARLAPTWARPHLRLAQTYNATGRSREAERRAQAALRRAPNDLSAHITMAEVLATLLDDEQATGEDAEVLLARLEAIRESVPEYQRTLPIYVKALARTGRKQEALDAIAEAMEGDAPLSEETLLGLAELSRQHDLGITDELLEAAGETHGVTASLAYAEGLSTHAAGDTAAALARFRERLREHGGQSVTWQLAYARFLDVIEHEEAADTWRTLARAHPDNINLQRTVLGAEAVQGDRALMEEAIERVRELGGEEGLTWRMARGRWLLGGDGGGDAAEEAIELLEEVVRRSPNLVEPRLLLTEAMRQAGDRRGAIEQLTLVADIQPENMDVLIDLARMRLRRGDYEDVGRLLNRVLEHDHAAPGQRHAAAEMLAELGQAEQAIRVLSDGADGITGRTRSDLLLAELYLRRGQPDRAEQVYRQLVEDRPGPQVIQAYANLLGAYGRGEEARAVLAMAEQAELSEAVVAMLHAEYTRSYGSAEQAKQFYRDALAADPANDSLWRRLVDFHLDRGEVEQALEVSAEAHEATGKDGAFALFVEERDLLRLASPHAQLRPLVRAMLYDAGHRGAALEVLQILQAADRQGRTFDEVAGRVRRLADQNPRFLELQNLAVDLYLLAGNYDPALTVAERAMQNFPNQPDPAQRATRVVTHQGDWDRVLRFAADWRDREIYRPGQADLAISDAHLQLDNPRAALEQIEPYLDQARQDPDSSFPVINIFTRGLAALGETEQAAEVLQPLLGRAGTWRRLWIVLATQVIEDEAVAVQWLEAVEPTIPEEETNERLILAVQWQRLGRRFDNADYRQRALAMFEAESDKAEGSDLLLTHAMLAYQEGDHATAERQYRRVLQLDERHPIALNNLAMLLAEREEDLSEALALAQRAVEVGRATGDAASFYDTLAYVQVQRGEYADAIANLQEAVQHEPEGVAWRVNLARAHHLEGDREEATAALEEVEAMAPDVDRLEPGIRGRLERLREDLLETQAAAP